MAASLTPYKNHECLIYAFHNLVHTLKTPAHLMIIGVGRLQEKIEKLINTLNLQENVHLLGFSKEVPAIYYHSDIKVLSSSGESFGAVIVEAALLKKPIIVSDQIAAANYIIFDRQTGLLFKNNDPQDLALQIKTLIGNKELRDALGLAAYELVRKNFTSDSLIANILHMYSDVYTA
jgi:glycosyltransferase involved in cell wall biosynthesis